MYTLGMWIRNPWWDGFWILSGIPLGLGFTVLSLWVPVFWIVVGVLLVFQTGHSISPVALAWNYKSFREHMLAHPGKYIWLPTLILAGGTLAGYVIGLFWPAPRVDLTTLNVVTNSIWNPLWIAAAAYGLWNIYHFGKQNFGVMSIYRGKAGSYDPSQRRFDLVFCLVVAWATVGLPIVHAAAKYSHFWFLGYYEVLGAYLAIALAGVVIMLVREWRTRKFCLPRVTFIVGQGIAMATVLWWSLGALALMSMNHWLSAIGLAGHTYANHRGQTSYMPVFILFSGVVIVAGIALFCLLFVDLKNFSIPTQVAATAVAFRLALGNVHFLYDRWVWRFSDPQVRATIGKDLFAIVPASRMSPSLVSVVAGEQTA